MPEYLATGRNPSGKKVTECVVVASADEAVQTLRDRGYDEIVLHTDDAGALYIKQSTRQSVMSPQQFLRFRSLPRPLAKILFVAGSVYKRYWYGYLLALTLLGYLLASRATWGTVETALAFYLLLPVAFALAIPLIWHSAGRYRRLAEAVSWGRWEEVLARAESVGFKIAPDIIALHKAQALAGLGRLGDALRLLEPSGEGQTVPDWLIWSRRAEIYSIAKRRGDAKAAMEKALELAPENPIVLIGLAKSEVWHRHNTRLARELLAQARTHALSDQLEPFAEQTQGLIRLEEGHAREAREILEGAYKKASAFRHSSPLMVSALDLMRLPLALAYAAEGDIDTAARYYHLVRPRLLALNHVEEIARCEKALGLPPGG